MGIEGGISVIGTSGIVDPMSNAALVDTIRLELKKLLTSGARAVLLVPCNYGNAFAGNGVLLDSRVM
jgi:cobalt-precorrin-5B (C1)-methyltransferase